MALLPQNSRLNEAIKVTPISSHRYTTNLSQDWAIGAVPHGGYSTALLCNVAVIHFQTEHSKSHNGCARPIAIQLSFIRSTFVGPATIFVEDIKLGARVSVLHLVLSQKSPKGGETSRIVAYITLSDSVSDHGLSIPRSPRLFTPLHPLKPPTTTEEDGWKRVSIPFQEFRRAATQAEIWHLTEDQEEHQNSIDHQWARFRSHGHDGRWTNQALPYLLDIFPVALSRLERLGNEMISREHKSQASSGEKVDTTPFWFPTLALQADFRKELPPEGVEWLYSHIQFRSITNGRTNINITILDKEGDVIVYTSQTGLIMNSSRNVGLNKKENL